MKVYLCEQRSETWDKLRLGIPTASRFDKLLTPGGKLSSQAEDLMDELLAEWYYGGPLDDVQSQYQSQWMERGTALEDSAVRAYEFETGNVTFKIGFVSTDDGLIGCSPDRFIGQDGVLEIKVPSPKVHMKYMRKRCVDTRYYSQIQGALWITQRQFVDIVSYSAPFPMVIIRVPRDEEFIGLLADALREFTTKMLQARTLLEKTYGPPLRDREPEPAQYTGDDFVTEADVTAIWATSQKGVVVPEPNEVDFEQSSHRKERTQTIQT